MNLVYTHATLYSPQQEEEEEELLEKTKLYGHIILNFGHVVVSFRYHR